MSAVVLRGDAAHLPIPDGSVDLLLCSPPYWGLRSYTDGGEHYEGQIGSEETPQEWLEAMWTCTREWIRVLKPGGSIFVDLGDKYAAGHGGRSTEGDGDNIRVRRTRSAAEHWTGSSSHPSKSTAVIVPGFRPKTLMGLPWRYAIGCIDGLDLILRRDIVWHKTSALPESVTDRCATRHEYVFHFTKQPRYFSAVDEIREPAQADQHTMSRRDRTDRRLTAAEGGQTSAVNPLGKLPGSVWGIPAVPLVVPEWLGVDHFAAWPPELCRRIILGWSPSGICLECGEGRRPIADVVALDMTRPQARRAQRLADQAGLTEAHFQALLSVGISDTGRGAATQNGTGKNTAEVYALADEARAALGGYAREYLLRRPAGFNYVCACAQPDAPTRPAVVVDPFGGTGTTSLVADVLGRTGITVDRSADYCRLARWRTRDPAERARALGVPKPPPVPEGQQSLFDEAS